jgi:parallel beta-helix repeat protein
MRNTLLSTQSTKAIVTIVLMTLFVLPVSAISQPRNEVTPPQPTTSESTIYVDANNTNGPWDGSLEHPYQYIQDGIDNACYDDTVFVFHGTYHESIVIYKDSIEVVGERRNDTIIDGQGYGTCVRFTSEYSSLRNFTIQHSGKQKNDSAITFDGKHCAAFKNIIRDSHYGVYAINHGNAVFYNNFFNNTVHAYSTEWDLWDDSCGGGNYWEGFARIDDDENGIIDTPYTIPGGPGQDCYPLLHPYGSVVNLNTNKVFFTIAAAIADDCTSDGDVISVAKDTYWEHPCVDKELTIIGQNRTQTIIDGRYSRTVLWILSANVTIQGFTIQDGGLNETDCGVSIENNDAALSDLLVQHTFQGIVLQEDSRYCSIHGCTISSNTWNGITINQGCSDNLIDQNAIQENGYCGLLISEASYNTVYHNIFSLNRLQAFDSGFNIWDDGYPSGGNCWSDYKGRDANHDGIGDTPYAIQGGANQDRYPLMHLYFGVDTKAPTLTIISPTNGLYVHGHHFLGRLIHNKIVAYGRLKISADAFDNESGIREVRFYLDQSPDAASIVTQAPYTWTWKTPTLLPHKHTITVVVFDNAGNFNQAAITVRRWM